LKVVVEEFHGAIVKFDDFTIGNSGRSQLQQTVTSCADSLALNAQNPQTLTKSNILAIALPVFPSLKVDNLTTVPLIKTVRSEDFSPHKEGLKSSLRTYLIAIFREHLSFAFIVRARKSSRMLQIASGDARTIIKKMLFAKLRCSRSFFWAMR
jgi:hypothetical protein